MLFRQSFFLYSGLFFRRGPLFPRNEFFKFAWYSFLFIANSDCCRICFSWAKTTWKGNLSDNALFCGTDFNVCQSLFSLFESLCCCRTWSYTYLCCLASRGIPFCTLGHLLSSKKLFRKKRFPSFYIAQHNNLLRCTAFAGGYNYFYIDSKSFWKSSFFM